MLLHLTYLKRAILQASEVFYFEGGHGTGLRYPRAIKHKGGSGTERSYEIQVVHFQTNATACRHKH